MPNDKYMESAYNLWARAVDRPAEWWFGGKFRIWVEFKLSMGRHVEPWVVTPDEACRLGYAKQVYEAVDRSVVQMEKVW